MPPAIPRHGPSFRRRVHPEEEDEWSSSSSPSAAASSASASAPASTMATAALSKGKEKKKSDDTILRRTNCIDHLLLILLLLALAAVAYQELRIREHRTNGTALPRRASKSPSSQTTPAPPKFSVDILSIGSLQRLSLLQAQNLTMAAHLSVRHFFPVTEDDDADPLCHVRLTLDHVYAISHFCRSRPRGLSRVFYTMRGYYSRWKGLKNRPNAVGWMCAQVRPLSGLWKVYKHYVKHRETEGLPDYLLIVDDDTYFNMELFQRTFDPNYHGSDQSINNHHKDGPFNQVVVRDSNINSYYAGCLVRWPVKQLNNTFAYGGYGSILSKGSLINLFRPLHCDFPGVPSAPILDITSHTFRHPNNTVDDNAICRRLSANNVGEKRYFRNGWNLVQLMYAYVNSEKFVDVDKWTTGFCMHSDWVLGYFANYYNVSRHVEEAYYRDVAHARIEPYKGSELYAHPGKGFCKQDKEKGCRPDSEICHRVSEEWMRNETERWRVVYPTKFRNVTTHDSTL